MTSSKGIYGYLKLSAVIEDLSPAEGNVAAQMFQNDFLGSVYGVALWKSVVSPGHRGFPSSCVPAIETNGCIAFLFF